MKDRNLLINVLIGFALLSIPILSSPDITLGVSLLRVPPFLKNFLGYFLLSIFFFLNYYWLIPRFYSKGKWPAYAMILLIFLTVISYLPSMIFGNGGIPIPDGPPPVDRTGGQPPLDMFRVRDTFIFQFLMVLVLSLSLRLDYQLKRIKDEKLKAEVSYLKAQINPHFLFNTLNSIYSLTLSGSEKAPEAILKLSELMRYVVTESASEKVPLEKELKYISDYIALQRLRIGKQVDLIFRITGHPYGKHLPPIILINFIENAFKYGIMPGKPSKITILITMDGKGLSLLVENDIVVDKLAIPQNTEEGASNSRQRLAYFYDGKFRLQVSGSNEIYKVELYIEML